VFFAPTLLCKNCSQPIPLTRSVEANVVPKQCPWPWGNDTLNFACLACRYVFEYSEDDCHWHSFGSLEKLVGYQLLVPCGIDHCVGLIQIHFVTGPGLSQEHGKDYANSFRAFGVPCTEGRHRTTGKFETHLSFLPLSEF
jgi:hypothetical protein